MTSEGCTRSSATMSMTEQRTDLVKLVLVLSMIGLNKLIPSNAVVLMKKIAADLGVSVPEPGSLIDEARDVIAGICDRTSVALQAWERNEWIAAPG